MLRVMVQWWRGLRRRGRRQTAAVRRRGYVPGTVRGAHAQIDIEDLN
jgi:hypothetical protein